MGTDPVVLDYVTWLKSWGASASTVRARRLFVSARLRAWGGLDGLTQQNIEAFLADLEPHGWTRPTYHAHLTDFCSWLVATGRLDGNPMDGMRKPRRPKARPKPLSDGELALVLAHAEGVVRDWILLALLAGLRVSEIARVRGQDITSEGIYVRGKGGGVEVLPCHPEIRLMADRYPSAGFWFPGNDPAGHVRSQYVSRDVAEVFRDCRISEGSAHRLRHTYATQLLRNGVHIRRVQRLMRHASLETTAGYTAVDEDELQAAVNLLRGSGPLPPAA